MGCGLRKEIEDMLSLTENPDRYRLVCNKRSPHDFAYTLEKRRLNCEWWDCAVRGYGKTKAAAMEDLLRNWREGKACLPLLVPARSAEELRMKLVILGDQT